MVWKLKAKYEWYFCRLKMQQNRCCRWNYNETAKTSTNNVFRRKQITKKVPPNIFKDFEVRQKVRLMFWRSKVAMIGKCHNFISYKERTNLCLVNLERKLQKDRRRWCIFNLKCHKVMERTHLETSKQQRR